jgi:hypothetical protein
LQEDEEIRGDVAACEEWYSEQKCQMTDEFQDLQSAEGAAALAAAALGEQESPSEHEVEEESPQKPGPAALNFGMFSSMSSAGSASAGARKGRSQKANLCDVARSRSRNPGHAEPTDSKAAKASKAAAKLKGHIVASTGTANTAAVISPSGDLAQQSDTVVDDTGRRELDVAYGGSEIKKAKDIMQKVLAAFSDEYMWANIKKIRSRQLENEIRKLSAAATQMLGLGDMQAAKDLAQELNANCSWLERKHDLFTRLAKKETEVWIDDTHEMASDDYELFLELSTSLLSSIIVFYGTHVLNTMDKAGIEV